MTPAGGNLAKESIAKIEELVQQVQSLPDPAARGIAVQLVQAVMSLHASALERMLEIVEAAGAAALPVLAADHLVSKVLVLHGLHPDEFETRFAGAIDRLQRHFDSRGARLEVLEGGPEIIRLRFTASRPGAGRAARQTIEDALYEAVPELGELILEGAGEEHEAGFVPLAALLTTQNA